MTLLTLREDDSYGYELMERVAEFGRDAINTGHVLPNARADGGEWHRRFRVGYL